MAKLITITDESVKRDRMALAWEWVGQALEGGAVEVEIRRESRTRKQEKHFHALIGDIAKQVQVYGKQYTPDVWKALLVDGFEQAKAEMGEPLSKPGRVVPSMDHQRLITVRASTTGFTKQEAKDFIEYLYSQGIEMGVKWSDPALRIYEEYRESGE